jgi:hypothetical protein
MQNVLQKEEAENVDELGEAMQWGKLYVIGRNQVKRVSKAIEYWGIDVVCVRVTANRQCETY